MKKILIICGEYSGSFYASLLAEQFRQLNTALKIYAMSGEDLKQWGVSIIEKIDDTAEIGFTEILKIYGRVIRKMKNIISFVNIEDIDAVVLVDYPDFNLRIAKKIKSSKPEVKIFYFITPQVWAWREGRVKQIKKYVDRVYPLYNFEVGFYKKYEMDCRYFGHPLFQILKPVKYDISRKTIGFLPGSRDSAFFKIFPLFKELAIWLKNSYNYNVAFALAKDLHRDIVLRELAGVVEVKSSHELMQESLFLIVASGTASLESAIIGTPHIFCYRISNLSYLIARKLVHLKYVSPTNFVADEAVIPELLQEKCDVRYIREVMHGWLSNPKKLLDISEKFDIVRKKLYGETPVRKVAEDILKCLEH